jgi:hypothetical protein
MLDEVVTSVATGAAGNVIAYMLSGPVDALRVQIANMFRHASSEERATVLRRLEEDTRALKEHKESESTLNGRWAILLASYLTEHPEARSDIEDFIPLSATHKTTIIGSQNNNRDGVFVGGDSYGPINLKGNA